MSRENTDSWRDSEGFGRDIQVSPGVWSVKGPDNEDHAVGCAFIVQRGILPCSCDATRKRFGRDHKANLTHWFERWLRWQKARSVAYATQRPMPWPVTGPDGDPWVPGIDFNDDETPTHAPWCNVEHPPGATPCRVVRKLKDVPQA
jgi:hypothetical protein